MTSDSGVTQHAISSITVDGKEYRVALRLAYDGVEYIGRLWFSDPNSDQMGIPDHGAVPGRRSSPQAHSAGPRAPLSPRPRRQETLYPPPPSDRRDHHQDQIHEPRGVDDAARHARLRGREPGARAHSETDRRDRQDPPLPRRDRRRRLTPSRSTGHNERWLLRGQGRTGRKQSGLLRVAQEHTEQPYLFYLLLSRS
jgi:hypothetical protein